MGTFDVKKLYKFVPLTKNPGSAPDNGQREIQRKKNCTYREKMNTNYGVQNEKEEARSEVLTFRNY